jgi:hypothetical protein
MKTPKDVLNRILKNNRKALLIKRILFLLFGISGSTISIIIALNLVHLPSVVTFVPMVASTLLVYAIRQGIDEKRVVQILRMNVEELNMLKTELEAKNGITLPKTDPFVDAPDSFDYETREIVIDGETYELRLPY